MQCLFIGEGKEEADGNEIEKDFELRIEKNITHSEDWL